MRPHKSRTNPLVVVAPPLPEAAGPAPTTRAVRAWLDDVTGELREALLQHLGGPVPGDARVWVVVLEAELRGYVEVHAARLWALPPEARLAHLVSLHPLLTRLAAEDGVGASRLAELRVGPWMRAVARAHAVEARVRDAEHAAEESVARVRMKLLAKPALFVPREGDPQLSFVAIVRTALQRAVSDARRGDRFGEEEDRAVGGDHGTARLVRDLAEALRAWEDALSAEDAALYALWLEQGAGPFWAGLAKTHPALHRRKSGFYRKLDALQARLAEVAGIETEDAVSPGGIQDLRAASGR